MVVFVSCEAPYKIVETTTTDSAGKQITTRQKYYQQTNEVPVVQPGIISPVVVSTYPYFYPVYRPFIVVRGGGYRGRRH
jgi:hypothetical protein